MLLLALRPQASPSPPPLPASPISPHLRTFLGPLLAPPHPCTFVGPGRPRQGSTVKAVPGLCLSLLGNGQQSRNVPHGEIKALVAGPMHSLPRLIKTRPVCVAL